MSGDQLGEPAPGNLSDQLTTTLLSNLAQAAFAVQLVHMRLGRRNCNYPHIWALKWPLLGCHILHIQNTLTTIFLSHIHCLTTLGQTSTASRTNDCTSNLHG